MLGQIVCQKPQHKISMRLKRRVLPSVPPPGVGIDKVLAAIDLDHQPQTWIKEIHLHLAAIIKWNCEGRIELESPSQIRQRLEAPE
jgi:hypothetical protein